MSRPLNQERVIRLFRELRHPEATLESVLTKLKIRPMTFDRWMTDPEFRRRFDDLVAAGAARRALRLAKLIDRALLTAGRVLDGGHTLRNANDRHVLIALLRMANAKPATVAKAEPADERIELPDDADELIEALR